MIATLALTAFLALNSNGTVAVQGYVQHAGSEPVPAERTPAGFDIEAYTYTWACGLDSFKGHGTAFYCDNYRVGEP